MSLQPKGETAFKQTHTPARVLQQAFSRGPGGGSSEIQACGVGPGGDGVQQGWGGGRSREVTCCSRFCILFTIK